MEMGSKTRVANKTIWALEDVIAHANDADRALERAISRASERMDGVAMVALAEARSAVAQIRNLAVDARHGEYRGGGTA